MQTSIERRPTNLKEFLAPISFKKQVSALIEEKPRAILIVGHTGLGKTTLADIIANKLAKSIKTDIERYNFADENGINSVRALIEKSKFLPRGYHKVIILEEAHAATKQAQDAFLSELDHPSHNKITYIFTTNQLTKLQKTFIDRCAKLILKIPPDDYIFDYLITLGFKKDIAKKAINNCGGSIRAAIQNADDLVKNGEIAEDAAYSSASFTKKIELFSNLIEDPNAKNMSIFLSSFESPFMAIKIFSEFIDITIQVKLKVCSNTFFVKSFAKASKLKLEELTRYASLTVDSYDKVRNNGELYYSRFLSIFVK